jgi:Glycosyltransferase Family 4/Glycosyl transferases group 1
MSAYKKSDSFSFDLICWFVDTEDQVKQIRKNITIHEMWTAYNKIQDNIRFTWRSFHQLRLLNKTQKIDIIHCLYPNSSLQAAVLYKFCIDRKVKILYDVRSPRIEMAFANKWISASKQRIKQCMHFSEKILLKYVDYFVFISEGTKQYYQEKYALLTQDAVSIIPTWVDIQKFSCELSSEQKVKIRQSLWISSIEQVIWYVWTVSKMRELSLFLKKQSNWIKENTVKFVIIWDGDDLHDLKIIINECGLDEKIIVLWKLKQSDLIPYMHIFNYWRCHLPDIFVFSNSFPLKIVEYIAAWIPVIASKSKAHVSIQQKLKNIWIYDTGFSDIPFDQIKHQWFVPEKNIVQYSRENLRLLYTTIYENLS